MARPTAVRSESYVCSASAQSDADLSADSSAVASWSPLTAPRTGVRAGHGRRVAGQQEPTGGVTRRREVVQRLDEQLVRLGQCDQRTPVRWQQFCGDPGEMGVQGVGERAGRQTHRSLQRQIEIRGRSGVEHPVHAVAASGVRDAVDDHVAAGEDDVRTFLDVPQALIGGGHPGCGEGATPGEVAGELGAQRGAGLGADLAADLSADEGTVAVRADGEVEGLAAPASFAVRGM